MLVALWILGLAGAALALGVLRRLSGMRTVAPELRMRALLIPFSLSPFFRALAMRQQRRAGPPRVPDSITMTQHWAEQPDGSRVRIVTFERAGGGGATKPRPAMLWVHGGGYVIGRPEQDVPLMKRILSHMDIVIVSPAYRLAPEHPFPAPLDDCHKVLTWLVEQAEALGLDPGRIAIGGQSAGGGLAAALVQRAVDQGPIVPALQLLVYPMLDAATTLRRDDMGTGQFIWTASANRYGWKSYLGRDPGIGDYPVYAVPASRASLKGLPPAWIGVGALDLFHGENLEYARRLQQDGVACDVYVAEAAYHGFDIFRPKAQATTHFYAAMLAALERGLGA